MKHYAYDEPEYDIIAGRFIGNKQRILSEEELRAKHYPEFLNRHALSSENCPFESFLDE